jgi:uncharacterized membrane protein YfcA
MTASLLLAAAAIYTAPTGARYAIEIAEWKLKRSFGGFLILISMFLFDAACPIAQILLANEREISCS